MEAIQCPQHVALCRIGVLERLLLPHKRLQVQGKAGQAGAGCSQCLNLQPTAMNIPPKPSAVPPHALTRSRSISLTSSSLNCVSMASFSALKERGLKSKMHSVPERHGQAGADAAGA